jgi:hypothetical protein
MKFLRRLVSALIKAREAQAKYIVDSHRSGKLGS